MSSNNKPKLLFGKQDLLKNTNKKWFPKNVLKHNLFKEILQFIFSIKNQNQHKVIKICGIKLKIKRGKDNL